MGHNKSTSDPFTALITSEQLASHLDDPAWIIVDCRFDLSNPDWGFSSYQEGHIRGAVFAHLDQDLAGPILPDSGRHPLPELSIFCETLSRLGISNSSQVIVYDTVGGAFAARLWWMLKYCGHAAVAVLDGGYARWKNASLPLDTGITLNPPGKFSPAVCPEMLVTTAQLELLIPDPSICLLDARSPIRFRGEQEPIDPIAGHIPSAINRFHGQNLTPAGVFLPAEELQQQFTTLLGGKSADHLIVYCGSGITSCHHIVAMAAAGINLPRLYVGSWSEWIRDPNHQISVG